VVEAIQYNIDARIDATGLKATYDAVLTDPNNMRLVQNAASTHVLVGLLAAVLLCAALASVVMSLTISSIVTRADFSLTNPTLQEDNREGTEGGGGRSCAQEFHISPLRSNIVPGFNLK